jgi:hypothetical protein
MSDQLVARSLPSQENITQKDKDKHPCPKWDLNPLSSVQALKTRASDGTATGLVIGTNIVQK